MTSDIGAWLESLGLGRYADAQSDSLSLQGNFVDYLFALRRFHRRFSDSTGRKS